MTTPIQTAIESLELLMSSENDKIVLAAMRLTKNILTDLLPAERAAIEDAYQKGYSFGDGESPSDYFNQTFKQD